MYAFFAVCFIPLIATFLILVIVVNSLKIRTALWACILALSAVLPIAFVQHFVVKLPILSNATFLSLLLTAILFNGVVEETLKMLCLLLIPSKKQTLASFFSASILFGLAIGSFESIIYLFRHIEVVTGQQSVYKLMLLRLSSAVLVHTFCAGLSGLFIWMGKHKNKHLSPFIYAVLLHGLYNFFAAFTSNFRYFSFAAILLAALECRIWYHLQDSASSASIKKTAKNA